MNNRTFQFIHNGKRILFEGNSFGLFHAVDDKNSLGAQPIIEYSPKRPFLKTLSLFLINNCNLKCDYCYGEGGAWDNPGLIMQKETALRAVDMLIESGVKNNGDLITISFFGGEPLLKPDLIEDIINHVEKNKPDSLSARYAMATNGTLIDKDIANYISEKKIIISLSIDGTKKMHDVARKTKQGNGSYDLLIKNMQLIPKDVTVIARMTISDHNVNVLEAVKHIKELGVERIDYELDYGISQKNMLRFIKSSKKLLDYYIACIKNEDYFEWRNISKVLAPFLLKKRAKAHCNAGVAYLAISADGLIYPCHRFVGMQDLVIADIKKIDYTFLQNHIKNFDESLKTCAGDRSEKCKKCAFDFLGGGMCLYVSYVRHGKFFAVENKDCILKKLFFEMALKLLLSLNKNELGGYIQYLLNLWKKENRKNIISDELP